MEEDEEQFSTKSIDESYNTEDEPNNEEKILYRINQYLRTENWVIENGTTTKKS
jgi:hypothetical protein